MDILVLPLVLVVMFLIGIFIGRLLPLEPKSHKGYSILKKSHPKAQIIKRVAEEEKAIQDVINEN